MSATANPKAKEVVIRIPSYKSTVTNVSDYKQQPYHGFCFPLAENAVHSNVESPRNSTERNTPDPNKPFVITSPQTARRTPVRIGDPLRIVVPSGSAVELGSPKSYRRSPSNESSYSTQSYQSNTGMYSQQNRQSPVSAQPVMRTGFNGTNAAGNRPYVHTINQNINELNGNGRPEFSITVVNSKTPQVSGGRNSTSPSPSPSSSRTTKAFSSNSALNSFIPPEQRTISKRISPPGQKLLDRSTARNIITAHLNQMVPDQNNSSGPNSPGVRGASNLRKAPKVHGQTHSWLAQAAESLHFLEKSRNNGHKDVSQSRSAPLDLQNNEPSDRAVKMRTSVYIPNMSGNSLASHQQERVKRRRSLTKTSMHELGVDDLRPWAQPPPKSPVPHKSPSTDGTMDPFLALALKNNASAAKKSPSPEPRKSPVQKVSAPTGPSKAPKVSLDCPDRPTMRALLDDLDNITIQAHQEIDKFKLEDQRNKALREPNPITIQVPTVKSNFIPSSIQQQSESSQKLQQRSTPAPTSSPTPVSSNPSVEKLAKRTTSPELKRTSPPSQSAQSAISAPKIIRSSVGTSRTSSSNVKQEKSSLISGSSRLSQLKNKLQNKIKPQETQHTTPDISKTPVTQPKEVPARKSPEPPPAKSSLPKEKTSVEIKPKFEQKEHKAKEPEPSPKKVEFTKDLGTVENSAQSVKAWQESPERKTVNIMAQMMKKVAEDEETKIKPIGAAITPVEPPKKRPQIVARKEQPKSNVEKDLNRLLNPTFTAPEPVESSQNPVSPPVKTNDQIKQKKFPPVEKFHFPFGKPRPAGEMSGYLQAIDEYAKRNRKQEFFMKDMGPLVKEMKLPFYWKDPLFRACGGKPSGKVSIFQLGSTWKKICETRFDSESQLMALLTYGTSRNYLVPSDLTPLITDVIETHPGLEFLRSAPEFHTRYVTTVIARLFYIASAWNKKLYVPGLRKSEFAQVLNSLDSLDDINNEQRFFSYEHFYVIYCRFWELDSDHDLRIGPTDLSKYGDYSIAVKAIDRILSGTVTAKRRVMEYSEFVWFIMSEEDKSTATSSEYWFRVMDRDGDGAITIDDLEFFYAEQETRLRTLGVEPLPFLDLLCLMLDLVKPEQKHLITLRDLKKCRLQHIFFDTFLNAEKYLDREQREPFDGNQEWNWARWATEEYSLLVADEDD